MASPTLTVQLDDGSGSFPFDISAYVLATESYDITRGRDDWQGAVTAGQLSLTLNNSDGRFTPGSTTLGATGGFGLAPFGLAPFGLGLSSSSPIVVDQQIRLRETVNGTTYTRFTGYVKSWPVSWPATVGTFSTVRITATDLQARAERRPLRSVLEEEVVSAGPSAYYTLSEATGATAAGDTSGNNKTGLTIAGTGAAPTFGGGTGPDGLSAVTFAGGQYLRATSSQWIGTGAWTVHVAFGSTGSTVSTMVHLYDAVNGVTRGELSMTNTGSVRAQGVTIFGLDSPRAYNDGATHDAILTFNGSNTLTLYVDGVLVASSAFAVAPPAPATRLTVGGGDTGQSPFTGTLSHVAVFDGVALTPTQVTTLSTAALTQFAGEAGTDRLARLARYMNLGGGFDASLTNVSAATGWTGSSAWDQIQRVADAEFGVVYVNNFGTLTFHNRNRVAAKTTPDLTLSSQYITPDVQPVVDDQRLINYMEVSADGTGATNLVSNAASDTAHGRYPGSQSYLVQTDAEALDRGRWIVAQFADPGATPRYGTLTINLFGMPDSQAAAVLGVLDLDCWLRVTSAPSQNPGGSTVDVIVQGWSASRTAESWTITCNVVPRSLYAPVWILETSQLDANARLYV